MSVKIRGNSMLFSVPVAARSLVPILWMFGIVYADPESAFQKASPREWAIAKAHTPFVKQSRGDHPEVQRVGLMRFNEDALKTLSGEVALPLFEQEDIVISVRKVARKTSSRRGEIEWEGVVVGSTNSQVHIVDFGKDEVHGEIQMGKDMYALSPIGNGLLMITHFDLDNVLMEGPPLESLGDSDSAAVRGVK